MNWISKITRLSRSHINSMPTPPFNYLYPIHKICIFIRTQLTQFVSFWTTRVSVRPKTTFENRPIMLRLLFAYKMSMSNLKVYFQFCPNKTHIGCSPMLMLVCHDDWILQKGWFLFKMLKTRTQYFVFMSIQSGLHVAFVAQDKTQCNERGSFLFSSFISLKTNQPIWFCHH